MAHPAQTPASEVHNILSKSLLVDGFDFVMDLEKSQGSWLLDARHGKKYLDLFTFFASSPIGFNHPKLLTERAKKELLEAAIHKPSNSDLYTVPMAEFVKTFREKAMPKEFRYAFFIEGGALAVENALKVAFDYKVRANFRKGATREIGSKVVHFKNAFHGRSGYTLSLTNTLPDKIAYFPKFDWPRLDTPGLTFPITSEVEKCVAAEEERILTQLNWLGEKQGDEIAAVIIETIQSEGGDVHFRREFLQGLRNACDKFDWLLIFDEVQAGFGITGKMWAFEHYGVLPDIVAFGKKSQVCGIMARETVDKIPDNVFHVPSRINSTWGGNLVDMVRCKHYLEIMHEDKLIENAARQGERLLKGLQEIQSKFSHKIHNARGRGLLCAFTFHKASDRGTFIDNMNDRGAIILPCGPSSIRFRPALTIGAAEIDEGLRLTQESLAALK
jgi:L-lysine 6-transaminase